MSLTRPLDIACLLRSNTSLKGKGLKKGKLDLYILNTKAGEVYEFIAKR